MALWDITAVVEKGEVMKTGLRTKETLPVTTEKNEDNNNKNQQH